MSIHHAYAWASHLVESLSVPHCIVLQERNDTTPGPSSQQEGLPPRETLYTDTIQRKQYWIEPPPVNTTHYHSLLEMFQDEGRRRRSLEIDLNREQLRSPGALDSKLSSPRGIPTEIRNLEEMLATCKRRMHQLKVRSHSGQLSTHFNSVSCGDDQR